MDRQNPAMVSMSVFHVIGMFIIGGSLGFALGAFVQSRLDKITLNRLFATIRDLDRRLAEDRRMFNWNPPS